MEMNPYHAQNVIYWREIELKEQHVSASMTEYKSKSFLCPYGSVRGLFECLAMPKEVTDLENFWKGCRDQHGKQHLLAYNCMEHFCVE